MNDEIAGLIAAARAEERERCAKAAELAGAVALPVYGEDETEREMAGLTSYIAAAIRALGDE